MANARKCDRCGKLYEIYRGIPLIEGRNAYHALDLIDQKYDRKHCDLCQDCMQEVVYFLTNVPVEKKTEENVSKEMSDAAIERGKWGVFG